MLKKGCIEIGKVLEDPEIPGNVMNSWQNGDVAIVVNSLKDGDSVGDFLSSASYIAVPKGYVQEVVSDECLEEVIKGIFSNSPHLKYPTHELEKIVLSSTFSFADYAVSYSDAARYLIDAVCYSGNFGLFFKNSMLSIVKLNNNYINKGDKIMAKLVLNTYLEFGGEQYPISQIEKYVKERVKALHPEVTAKEIGIYMQPETDHVYYTINGEGSPDYYFAFNEMH